MCSVYRASFAQTFAEMEATNKGEWKSVVAMIFAALGVTGWLLMYCRKYGAFSCFIFIAAEDILVL